VVKRESSGDNCAGAFFYFLFVYINEKTRLIGGFSLQFL